jgi:hypothetical protein
MFAFTKVVKLMGLFIRNPSDIMFLPVSVIFGYFHGLIKLYALITLNMVRFNKQVPKQSTNHPLFRLHGVAELMEMPTMSSDLPPLRSLRSF